MAKWKVFGEKQLVIDSDVVIRDIDLDQEVVIVDGQRLTEARAEQISEEIMQAYYEHHDIKFTPRKLDIK
jgi:hypothetical protein